MRALLNCVPKIDVKADGQDQTVAGTPYYDTISVKVLNDRSIEETEKKNGKTVRTSRMTVSDDGNSATVEIADRAETTNGDPITGKLILTRPPKAKHPRAGSHAISGSWLTSKMMDFSDNALIFKLKVEGDTLTVQSSAGQSYTANLDGTVAPYLGDPGINRVSVLRLGEHTFSETDKSGAKSVRTARMMIVSGSTNTMNLIVSDLLRDSSVVFVAEKQ